MFEDGIVIGFVDRITGQHVINPRPGHRLGGNEDFIILRPTVHAHVSSQHPLVTGQLFWGRYEFLTLHGVLCLGLLFRGKFQLVPYVCCG
jgi:hypothetical protein